MHGRVTLATLAAALLFAAPASADLPSGNLVVNPGAEAAPGAQDSATSVPLPGWTVSGPLTAVAYGASSFPTTEDGTRLGGGANFFAGGPDGDVKYYWVLENGKLLDSQLGEISDADFTLTQSYDDSVKVQKGELDANAAFMQGRVKVTGNMAKLMALLPLTNAPEYKALQEQINAMTEY